MDRHQRGLDVRLHLAAVAADEDHGALFDQAPDLVLLSREQVLDISLRPVAAREAGVELADAVGRKALELVRVEEILFGMAAAEEQHGRSQRCTLGVAGRALLQKAAERREPRA